ncbi:hypothetical protein Q8F55_000461 [Vanrija albida]|uniref:VTT domain-containing protein n=1 Tax=Vanrija albida TaxID=181172 RepID=A0ABR3QDC5_9TREE
MHGAPPSWFPHGRGRIRLDDNDDDDEPKDAEATELVDQTRRRRPSATIVALVPDQQSDLVPPPRKGAGHSFIPPRRSYGPHPAEAGEAINMHPCDAPPRRSARNFAALHVVDRPSSRASSVSVAEEGGEVAPLLDDSSPPRWYQGPLAVATIKLSVLFTVFSVLVLGTFWFGMPKVSEEDRPALKLPRSFADLQALNTLFQKYKEANPGRLLLCGVVAYLYVQAFSLPGSMYISILFGAAYGIWYGLILSCLCEATGSILCYTLSAILGPPLLEIPFYRKKLDVWRKKIMGDEAAGTKVGKDSIFAFLVVLRIMPLPPHWMANFVAPHLGIGIVLFWSAVFVGIAPLSVIHVMVGSSLDQMTSADDFQIISVRNVLGLVAVAVAVLIPIGLKRVFKTDLSDLGPDEQEQAVEGTTLEPVQPVPVEFDASGRATGFQAVDSGIVLAGPSDGDVSLIELDDAQRGKGKGRSPERLVDIDGDDAAYDLPTSAPTSPPPFDPSKPRPLSAKGYGTIAPTIEDDEVDAGRTSDKWYHFGSSRLKI